MSGRALTAHLLPGSHFSEDPSRFACFHSATDEVPQVQFVGTALLDSRRIKNNAADSLMHPMQSPTRSSLMNQRVETRLSLIVVGPALRSLCLLTGGGFQVGIGAACTLRELLCGQMGIAPAYLESRIQTMFLNHKAVDDPKAAMVTAGSTIGLSGAMPGIAGAMLRKGSRLSSMRRPISHVTQDNQPPTRQAGDVTVRLFNVLQEELGPSLLAQGIRITGAAFTDFLGRQTTTIHSVVRTAEMDSRTVPVAALYATDWTERDVHLQVTACSSSTANMPP
jgi:hypothetical protein